MIKTLELCELMYELIVAHKLSYKVNNFRKFIFFFFKKKQKKKKYLYNNGYPVRVVDGVATSSELSSPSGNRIGDDSCIFKSYFLDIYLKNSKLAARRAIM